MNIQNKTSPNHLLSNEVDYVELLNKLWLNRKVLVYTLSVGLFIGLLIAFLSPKVFKVTTTMLPQNESESSMGKISSLASLAGFDLDLSSGESDISPIIFPQIVESAPFLLELMNKPLSFEEVNHPVSIFDYYTKIKKPSLIEYVRMYTVGLPGLIKSSIKQKRSFSKPEKDGPIVLTEEQDQLMVMLKGNLDLSINKKEGYLTLSCYMSEPLLAAQLCQEAITLLQKYIIDFKTIKSTEQLRFIEQRYAEKKSDCLLAQNRFAAFRDRNWHATTASALAEQERLQDEYDIANSVYSELAKSLEQAKIQVKRQTPVFAVIKPVVVPLEKFGPNRMKVLTICAIVGLVFGVALIFFKDYMVTFMKQKKNKQATVTD